MKAKRQLLPAAWKVPEDFRRRLGSTAGRQRAMIAGNHLLLVFHIAPKADEISRSGRFFWRDESGSWSSSDVGAGTAGLHKHLDQYEKLLLEYDLLDEEATCAEQYLKLLDGVSPLMRAARNMLQVFEDARKAVPDDRTIIDCRDRAYEISRTAELLYNDAKNGMDVAVVRRAEEQADVSARMSVAAHRLNVLVAMFFPIATLAAVFSTSLTDGWQLSNTPIPFAVFILIGLISGIVLATFITRPAAKENTGR